MGSHYLKTRLPFNFPANRGLACIVAKHKKRFECTYAKSSPPIKLIRCDIFFASETDCSHLHDILMLFKDSGVMLFKMERLNSP